MRRSSLLRCDRQDMYADELPSAFVIVTAFVFGATWGSFLNVAIYRWPRGMSVVHPPSRCPSCETPVPWYRNVPILAYLAQRGRAACCGAKLTPRYVWVEAATGVLALALAKRLIVDAPAGTMLTDALIETVVLFVMSAGLIVATFVDLEWMEIPDEVSLGGTAFGLAFASFRGEHVSLAEITLGAGGAFLVVQLLLVWSWEQLFHQRGMGEGDSKLAMMIGAFLGWKGALFALIAGSFQGVLLYVLSSLVGGSLSPSRPLPKGLLARLQSKRSASSPKDRQRRLGRRFFPSEEDDAVGRRLPFGPFLALGAIEFAFAGPALIDAYLRWFT